MNNTDKVLKALSIIEELEVRKALYAELDALTLELREEGFESLTLPDGRTLELQDNFIDKDGNPKNTVFRPAGVKRFELAIKKAPKKAGGGK